MTEDPAAPVFEALSDPVRRRLLARLASGPATATELAAQLPISRQAVSKHLASLSNAGLLERERAGRDVRYRMTPEPLSDAVGWMAQVGGRWDARLGRLAESLGSRWDAGASGDRSDPGGATPTLTREGPAKQSR